MATPLSEILKNSTADPVESAGGFRQLQYGFASSAGLTGDLYRLGKAAFTDKTIEEIEQERLKEVEEKFPDITEKDKSSGLSMLGSGVGMFADPSTLVTGPLVNIARGSRAAAVAANVGIGNLYSGAYITARGEDVTTNDVLFATAIGGAFGLGTNLVSKAPKAKVGDLNIPLPAGTTVSEEKAIQRVINTIDKNNPTLIKSLEDLPNSGIKVAKAQATRQKYIDEYRLFKSKSPDALSKAELKILREERDAAKRTLEQLPSKMIDDSEVISDNFMKTLQKLDEQGILRENTIGRIVTRPLLGAAVGYGVGITTQVIDDDSEISPWAFAASGLLAGQLSKRIMTSSFSTNVKEKGIASLQELSRNSLKAQVNILTSGTTAARLNSLGDDVSAFGKTLFAQRGADLKGVATVSAEEAKDIAADELNKRFSNSLMGLAAYGDDSKKLREFAWKYGEKFIDDDGLAAQGLTAAQIVTVKNISKASQDIVATVSQEANNVGINFMRLKDYSLPQFHDYTKISVDPDKARAAYKRAFIFEAASKTDKPLTSNSITRIEKKADQWFDEYLNKGLVGQRTDVAWETTDAASRGKWQTRLTPLAKHFETDRVFSDFKARSAIQDYLVQDVVDIIPRYINNTSGVIEFSRRFGSKGEVINQLKKNIYDESLAAKEAARGDKKLFALADKVAQRKIKDVHDAVDIYFGTYHGNRALAQSDTANFSASLLTTLANTTYLTKVTIDSLGDLVQPLTNAGVWNGMKSAARSRGAKDFAEETGFAQRDVLSSELRGLMVEQSNPNNKGQRLLSKINQEYFKIIQLQNLTSYARRFAYNAGVEDAFSLATKINSKGMDKVLFNRAKALGLTDDYIAQLGKFKNVDEAFANENGKKILNIAGVKSADRDALIPQLGNRLGFSQSRDPLIKSMGQFLSWAQAKTTQTNALVQRIEDGDGKLAARMMGSLVLYDGILTFKRLLNDPTGKYLDDDEDSYFIGNRPKFFSKEHIARSIPQAGLTPFYIDKLANIITTPYNSTVFGNISPGVAYLEDLGRLVDSSIANIEQGDAEGLAVQFLRRVPLGRETEDILAVAGMELKDRPKNQKAVESLRMMGLAKGGEVYNVPNVPVEPDERIDKLTGRPYDEQAGEAFEDEEDRQKFYLAGVVALARKAGIELSKVQGKTTDQIVKQQAKIASNLKNKITKDVEAGDVSSEPLADSSEEGVFKLIDRVKQRTKQQVEGEITPVRPVPPRQLDPYNKDFDPRVANSLTESEGQENIQKYIREGGAYLDPRTNKVLNNKVISDTVIEPFTQIKPKMQGNLQNVTLTTKDLKSLKEKVSKVNPNVSVLKTNLVKSNLVKEIDTNVKGLKEHIENNSYGIVTVISPNATTTKAGLKFRKEKGMESDHIYALQTVSKGDSLLVFDVPSSETLEKTRQKLLNRPKLLKEKTLTEKEEEKLKKLGKYGYQQPSLKPHYVGDFTAGEQIGTIKIAGSTQRHPLYDVIYIDAEKLNNFAEGGQLNAQFINIDADILEETQELNEGGLTLNKLRNKFYIGGIATGAMQKNIEQQQQQEEPVVKTQQQEQPVKTPAPASDPLQRLGFGSSTSTSNITTTSPQPMRQLGYGKEVPMTQTGNASTGIDTFVTDKMPAPTDTKEIEWDQGLIDRNANYQLKDYDLGDNFTMENWYTNYAEDKTTAQRFADANQIWNDWTAADMPRTTGNTPFGKPVTSLQARTQAHLLAGKGFRQGASAAANWRTNTKGIERSRDDWTKHDVYYTDFMDKLNEKGISQTKKLDKTFELEDFPFEYDNSQLYMKLPDSKYTERRTHTGPLTQDKMLDKVVYIDVSGGDAPVGSYSLMKVTIPKIDDGTFLDKAVGVFGTPLGFAVPALRPVIAAYKIARGDGSLLDKATIAKEVYSL